MATGNTCYRPVIRAIWHEKKGGRAAKCRFIPNAQLD